MGVKREVIERPQIQCVALIPLRAQRGESGSWSVDVHLGFDIPLDGGARHVRVNKQIRVRAEQIGRKKMRLRFIPKRGASTRPASHK